MSTTPHRRRVLIVVTLALTVIVGAWAGLKTGLHEAGDRRGRPSAFAEATADRSGPPSITGDERPSEGAVPSPSGPEARGDVTVDARRQQLIGVRVAPVERGSMTAFVRTTGVVRYNETRLTDINVRVDGWIRDLYVDFTGQLVTKGQRLFTLYSPDLLATQNEFLLALKTRDQTQGSQVSDAREYAERIVEAARQRLTLWDLSSDQLKTIEATRQSLAVIAFTSPASGYVLEKQALRGMHVTAGQMLYKLADLSTVWVEADVYEQEMPSLRVGQRATVTLDAYPADAFEGRAIYVYPFVEENTRTVKVRFQFANPRGRLKPGMYANVQLEGTGGSGLIVPANAVLDSGVQQTVFVAQGDGVFTPRSVKTGRRLGDRVQILEGVKEGEQVATSATFFLDSESQLRGGLQNYEAAPSAVAAPTAREPDLDITFRPQPDPPKTGESTFEVTLKDPSRGPVTDVDVSVTLFMPAMPTMNMPAMRNETKLPHAGNGVYRGAGQVMMAGRWDVTVQVSKGGRRIGSKQFALVSR